MDDLDELLAGLDNTRVSTRAKSQRTPSSVVDYEELNKLMLDLAAPSTTNSVSVSAPSNGAASRPVAAANNNYQADSYAREQPPVRQVQPQRAQVVHQPAPQVQPSRPVAAPAAQDDLEELLKNLGPPSAPSHAAPANQYANPVRLTQPPAAAKPAAQSKPPPRPLGGSDLDNLLADINKTSARDYNAGGPAARGDCSYCRKPILGEVIQAMNLMFHPEHFVCSNCSTPLGTANFYEQDGTPNCEKCYQELFCSRCAHCEEPITGRCVTALNRKWHLEHFICSQCLGPFGGGTFFERDGRPYCDNCFHHAFSSRCAGCNQAIKGETINALGQQWHPEHFVCAYCQKSFGNGSFYEHAGKPYCEAHYHQQTGSVCGGCGKAVTGRAINALDKKWHPEHFVCSFCMHPLAGGAFTESGGKAYCKECHSKIYGN